MWANLLGTCSYLNLLLLDNKEQAWSRLMLHLNMGEKRAWNKNPGSTEIWTRIAGFKVQSANHYTIEPRKLSKKNLWFKYNHIV